MALYRRNMTKFELVEWMKKRYPTDPPSKWRKKNHAELYAHYARMMNEFHGLRRRGK